MHAVNSPIRPERPRRVTRLALGAAAALVAGAVVVGLSPGADRTVQAVGDPLGAGGEFHSVSPDRIFDSRDPELDVAPLGRKPSSGENADTVFQVPIVGVGGLPEFKDDDGDGFDDNVLAVVANVTVVQPTAEGYLTMYPNGASPGTTSVLNFKPFQNIPNTAILRPGQNGEVSVQLVTPIADGTADVVIDVSGWFSTSSYTDRGARVMAIDPVRVYDSELDQFGGATLRTGANVVGVIVNLTGVNSYASSLPTHFALVPDAFTSSDPPSTSNLNLVTGQTRANLAILPVGDDGSIRLYNLQGEVRAVVDVAGYLLAGQAVESRAGRVIPLVAPFRAFDTREEAHYDQPLGPRNAEAFSFEAFVNDVKVNGESVGPQSGLFGNLTAVDLEKQYPSVPVFSHMTAYPTPVDPSDEPPNVSNLNLGEGEAVPNLALLRYGGTPDQPSRISFFNYDGYVDYLLDVYAIVLDELPDEPVG
jgi:hypothetical protein